MAVHFGDTENDFSVDFTVYGDPQGKARPRVTMHGTYTPKKTRDYEKHVLLSYDMQCAGAMFPADAALQVVINAYFPIPKSAGKRKRDRMQEGEIRPKVKPDLDNIAKAICDALNGNAWRDDAQVVSLHVQKYYDEKPRCEVQIRTVTG